MIRPSFLSHVACATAIMICALVCSSAPAQISTIAPRINGPIDEASLTALHGNVTSRARQEFDQGEAAPATELTFMRLVLSRSPEQEAALRQFMAEQLDKSSPNYHHWLTPDQFGKLYGPADSDIAAIVAWLQSHGLRVESVATGRTNIAFSGTVSQVEEAFHTPIHAFDDHAEQFLSNTTDPRIPSALAPVISGVANLNTLRPKPQNVPASTGKFDPATRRLVPSTMPAERPVPGLTIGTSGSYQLFLVPADAATIYDTPNSTLNANFPTGGTPYTGAGVSIGIVGDALIQPSTVVNYRSKFLNDSIAPTITNVAPAATAGNDTDEGYLDVEISGGLAPGASLVFYTSGTLQNAISQAINDNKVDILSVSFGECELDITNGGNQLLNTWWQQAATAGIAVVVSTGDSGSAGCDNNNTETTAVSGLQVNGFASTPYNIAVGGTDFNSLITGFTTYVNTTNSVLSGSAKGYIPESTWNDSTTMNALTNANIPALDMNNKTNITSGGGGVSACSTNTTTSTIGTCTSGYPKPSWQRGAGVPPDGARDLPDVSLFAGAGMHGAAWLVCTDDAYSSGAVGQTTNCVPNSSSQFAFSAFGGTSTSAPAFAGILALVQEGAKNGRLGPAVQNLYDLFNGSHAGTVFHDITVGNNSVVCTVGSPNCVKNGAGNYFLSGSNTTSGYDTNAGYDLATGMGSVDATQLVNFWASATGSAAAAITVTPSATNITSIQGVTVAVSVAGSGSLPAPTGTVTLAGGGYNSSATPLSAGTASFTIPAGTLQIGTDPLTATYSGDATYATTSRATNVTVTSVSVTITATTPNPAAVTPGISSNSTLKVSSSNGYAGSIALSCAVTASPANAVDLPTCTISPSTPITLSATTTSGTATVNITTTTPIASLSRPRMGGWETAGSLVLALMVFAGIPSRRRSWRALVGILLATIALLSVSACGSSSSSSGGKGNPGTTAGAYTFTITGTGTPPFPSPPTTTITFNVN
jgi:trimeric autotransporter adhesin